MYLSVCLPLSLCTTLFLSLSPTSLGLSPTLCLSVYLTPYVYVALSSPMSMWLSPPLCLSVFSPMTVCLLPYVCLALPTLCVFLSIPVLTFLLPHVYAHPTLRLSLCWIKLKKIQNVISKKVLSHWSLIVSAASELLLWHTHQTQSIQLSAVKLLAHHCVDLTQSCEQKLFRHKPEHCYLLAIG